MKNIKLYKALTIFCTASIILSACHTASKTEESNNNPMISEDQQESSLIDTEDLSTAASKETALESSTAFPSEETSTVEAESQTVENETFDYFESEKQEIKDSITTEDTTTIMEKGRSFFINAVDFIFYDKEYKGVTFDELTEEAKQQTYDNLCIIDGWIMKISPDYKENIEEKYTIVKDFIGEKGYFVLDKIKQYLGEENYEAIGNIKDKILNSAQNTGRKIKEKASDFYQSFKEKYQ